jgi:WD40 repeat protein
MESNGLPSGDKFLLCYCTVTYDAGTACVDQYDGLVYVGGKSDHAIHIYDVIATPTEWTLKEKRIIKDGHLKPMHAIALSNDGSKLASADERDVCVFDVSTTEYTPISPSISYWNGLGDEHGCLNTSSTPIRKLLYNMPALPPLPVVAVTFGICLHAPFSFLYHWKYAC